MAHSRRPLVLHVLATLTLLVVLGQAAGAGAYRIMWTGPEEVEASHAPPQWKELVNELLEVITSAAFQGAVSSAAKRVTTEERALNICAMQLFTCTSDYQSVVGLTLNRLPGGQIMFSNIPKSILSVVVKSSVLEQELRLDTLPQHIHQVRIEDVTFTSTTVSFRGSPGAQIESFACVNCNLTSTADASDAPPRLKVLDLSRNRLTDLGALHIPTSVVNLRLASNDVKQPFRDVLARMPKSVVRLDLSGNAMKGTLEDLRHLPASCTDLVLHDNEVSGDVSTLWSMLEDRARHVKRLALARNRLIGAVGGLGNAGRLQELNLAGNNITSLDLAGATSAFKHLNLSRNMLTGPFPLTALPRSLEVLDVSHNTLVGPITMEHLPPNMETFDISHNNFSGTIDLTLLPDSIRFVYIQYNQFEGQPNLVDLPVEVRRVIVHHNNWDSLLPSL